MAAETAGIDIGSRSIELVLMRDGVVVQALDLLAVSAGAEHKVVCPDFIAKLGAPGLGREVATRLRARFLGTWSHAAHQSREALSGPILCPSRSMNTAILR